MDSSGDLGQWCLPSRASSDMKSAAIKVTEDWLVSISNTNEAAHYSGLLCPSFPIGIIKASGYYVINWLYHICICSLSIKWIKAHSLNITLNVILLFFYTRWVPEVHNIYYQGSRCKSVPGLSNEAKLLSFFNCAATLMTSQLQNLALNSMRDYTHLISQDPVGESLKPSGQYILEEWNILSYRRKSHLNKCLDFDLDVQVDPNSCTIIPPIWFALHHLSSQSEPTSTQALCCIWSWRTGKSSLNLSSECMRRPSWTSTNSCSGLSAWYLEWKPNCSLSG